MIEKLNLPTWPHFDEDEIMATSEILRSGKVNYWTNQVGRSFERAFSDFLNVGYAVAVANGSVALEMALKALNIGPGDEVIVPCRSFLATASSVLMVGAHPVFSDVDFNSQNITAKHIEACFTERTKAVIAVHLAGLPCNMAPILSLLKSRNIALIEDCAQAHGARYQGQLIGSFGDIAAFSFCQDKIMSTGGEGGMVVTNNEALWQKLWSYKDHGKNYQKVYNQKHPPGYRWVHDSLGSNLRMCEFQSAIGALQLAKLPKWLQIRRQHAEHYSKRFHTVAALQVVQPVSSYEHAYYKYYVYVEIEKLKSDWSRDRIMQELQEHGVPVMTGVCPNLSEEGVFVSQGLDPVFCPEAKRIGECSLMLPLHPTLQSTHIEHICDAIEQVMHKAVKKI